MFHLLLPFLPYDSFISGLEVILWPQLLCEVIRVMWP